MKHLRFVNSGLALFALAMFFQAAHAAPQATAVSPQGRGAMQKLKEADKDQDGRLSKAEVAGMPLLSRHFDRIDADRDGRLTREELRGARDKMRRFRDEHFDTLRDMESESHQARIQILQQADACIKAAATTDAYRQCEQQEQAARQALRTSMQSKREGLTAQSRP